MRPSHSATTQHSKHPAAALPVVALCLASQILQGCADVDVPAALLRGQSAPAPTLEVEAVAPMQAASADDKILTCPASTLAPNFDCMVTPHDGFSLHWSVPAEDADAEGGGGPAVSYAIESEKDGYVSVGWSPDGMMVGALAVIAQPPDDVGAFSLDSKAVSGVVPTDRLTVVDESIETTAGGTTVVRFTVRHDEDFDVDADQPMIWAYGPSPALSYHGFEDRGAFTVNLRTG